VDEAAEDAKALSRSDALVRSFLALFKVVEAEAAARGAPAAIIMENPYATQYRGLWNRCVAGARFAGGLARVLCWRAGSVVLEEHPPSLQWQRG
jgi:hypothetical protein